MNKSIIKLLATLVFLLIFQGVKASEKTNQPLEHYFQEKLNRINMFMLDNSSEVNKHPKIMMDFVEQDLLTVWSAEHTIRALVGSERWAKLNNDYKNQMVTAYKNTMRRYLFEVMSRYDGQLASVENVRLNQRGNKGWLRVVLEKDNFPNLPIDLKIYNPEPEKKQLKDWFIYDFSFQGISFIKMKQDYFQNTFDKQGATALIEELNLKNQKFMDNLKAAD